MLKKFKSFGPKISLTESQIAKVAKLAEAAGLQFDVENCRTGSCYVTIYETEMIENIRGELYAAKGDEIAKIRLSGHDEGKRQDSTHCAIGTKAECLTALWSWIDAVIAEQAAK